MGAHGRLDELVTLALHEVNVYTDAATKPPPGAELNKRCVYTMEEVWPRDQRTNEVLTDARRSTPRDHTRPKQK